MNKKLQVFVSSTYTDLIEERQAAVEAILDAGHIPAGMELFKAGNESQLKTIYKWIDESDVYMLILGGRYGSIESKSGLSYTELEYRYALSKNMPVFAIVLDESFLYAKAASKGKDTIFEEKNIEKYDEFKKLVKKNIVRFPENIDQISSIIHSHLNNILNDTDYNLVGWIRDNFKNDLEKDKNKWKSLLFKGLLWFISTVLAVAIGIYVERGINSGLKYSSFIRPSLDDSGDVSTSSPFYYAKIPDDTNNDDYLVLQTGKTGNISIKLTNNDESTLTVNNIYLDVVDCQSITDIILSDGVWGGDYSSPIYYGVQLENLCKEYKCMILNEESAENFSTSCELPDETNFKVITEQIECNNTDEIEIIFSPMYSGIYRFKIIIDYSIRSFNDTIESDEFYFVSLDSSCTSQD